MLGIVQNCSVYFVVKIFNELRCSGISVLDWNINLMAEANPLSTESNKSTTIRLIRLKLTLWSTTPLLRAFLSISARLSTRFVMKFSFKNWLISTVCNTPYLKKVGHFYFHNKLGNSGPIFVIFFTVEFRNDLRRKLELKLSHPLKSVAAVPCET